MKIKNFTFIDNLGVIALFSFIVLLFLCFIAEPIETFITINEPIETGKFISFAQVPSNIRGTDTYSIKFIGKQNKEVSLVVTSGEFYRIYDDNKKNSVKYKYLEKDFKYGNKGYYKIKVYLPNKQ